MTITYDPNHPMYLDEAGAKAAAKELSDDGHTAIGIKLDVTDLESAEAAVAEVVTQLGGVDILVNNAGIMSALPKGKLLDLDVSTYLVQNLKLVEALVTGSNDRVRAPRMARRRGASAASPAADKDAANSSSLAYMPLRTPPSAITQAPVRVATSTTTAGLKRSA